MEENVLTRSRIKEIPIQISPIINNKSEKALLKIRVLNQFFKIILKKTRNLFSAINLTRKIRNKYQRVFGEPLLTKVAKVGGKYYWRLAAPGFPSIASKVLHKNEVNRFFPELPRRGLRLLILSITNKCPLNCEHCYEWPNLNKANCVSDAGLIDIVHKYQDFGTTQIMLSGGEPMLKINTIYKILEQKKAGTDFWIITSGLGFNIKKAKKLKNAGLTGVIVSLDHFERTNHDRFRGFPGAYENALNTIINANKVGLVTTLSLCATKEFTFSENLRSYMELAKNLGVSFVQLLEPHEAGRYIGKDIALDKKQTQLLEKTYKEYNNLKEYQEYPIINYLAYHQRRVGCFGAGDRFFYIDANGEAHICPVCAKKIGNALKYSAEEMINLLRNSSCHSFNENETL